MHRGETFKHYFQYKQSCDYSIILFVLSCLYYNLFVEIHDIALIIMLIIAFHCYFYTMLLSYGYNYCHMELYIQTFHLNLINAIVTREQWNPYVMTADIWGVNCNIVHDTVALNTEGFPCIHMQVIDCPVASVPHKTNMPLKCRVYLV